MDKNSCESSSRKFCMLLQNILLKRELTKKTLCYKNITLKKENLGEPNSQNLLKKSMAFEIFSSLFSLTILCKIKIFTKKNAKEAINLKIKNQWITDHLSLIHVIMNMFS